MFSKKINGVAVSLFVAIVLIAVTGTAVGQGADVWKDEATGLTWATKDNGMPITPASGSSYCDSLKAGGLSGWRLPTIDEAETAYDRADKKQFRTKGTIVLSEACVLTSSTTRGGDTWTFCFNNGARNIGGGGGCGTVALALCVNGAKKE